MAKRNTAMTTSEFRKSLRLLGVTPYRIAARLGVSLRQAHRYASGETGVPGPVAMVLRAMVNRLNEKGRPPG